MRDLYVDKEKLRLIYNPKKSDNLELFNHPEIMLSGKMKFHKYPEGFHNGNGTQISSVVCKMLITNPNHDGIWLIAEDDKDKVSIPGGHIGEDALSYILSGQVYTAIYRTLIREMMEENPILRGVELYEPIDIRATIRFILNQYGFNTLETVFPLYYSYDDYKGSFIIYMIKEVDNPATTIPPFSYYGFRNMVWYSRKEHSINFKTKADRRSLFSTAYNDDIRITDGGIKLLNKIFSTENIFGKLNIY